MGRVDRPPAIVSDLSARRSAPILSPRLEAGVELDPDDLAIDLGSGKEGDGAEGIRPAPVLDEGEAARGLAKPVEA